MNFPLVRYDAMVSAIIACHSVDEIKDLRDKAIALEMYAKQARNTDAERKACEVRLRAERRTGELLKELARDKGGRPSENSSNDATSLSPYAAALERNGMSRQTAHRYQALAEVPQEIFDHAMSTEPTKPSAASLLAISRAPTPKLDDKSLWIWGRARDFERDGFLDADPAALLDGMTETMHDDMVRLVPMLAAFFNRFLEELSHEPTR